MFTQRVVLTPALGQGRELTQALTMQTNLLQAQGVRASLNASLTGEGRISVGIMHDTLADLQALAEKYQADDAFDAFQKAIAPMQARLPVWELWELTVAANVTTAPKYVQRIVNTAGIGQASALRDLLSSRVRDNQANGIVCALSEQVASDAPRFGMVILFGSLAEFEAARARRMADPATQQFGAKVAALTSVHVQVEISQILIPFQLAAQRELAGTAAR